MAFTNLPTLSPRDSPIGMRILISGGTGFLGMATARRLKAAGYEVTVLGRNPRAGALAQKQGLIFEKVDLSERERVWQVCREKDIIIHCAALASPWGNYEDFYQSNVVGTRHILEGAQQAGVKRFINLSTPSLYFDYQDRFNIKESDPLPAKQVTFYGETKRQADEAVAAAFQAGLPTISLRPRAIFGPEDTTVLGRVVSSVRRGFMPLINGGVSYVDMTYIDNCVDALLLCLDSPPHTLGQTYNITNGEPLPTREMLILLFRKLDWKVRFLNLPYPVAISTATVMEKVYRLSGNREEPPLTRYAAGLMAKSQTLDISRARKELGYAPKISLEEGFGRYARWYRAQPTVQ